MSKKILVAEMKDDLGVKVVTPASRIKDVLEQIRADLDIAASVNVKFYLRTQKWVNSLPEYE